MALKTNRGRPGEVSLTACPFPECEEPIGELESFESHWPECPTNPANGGPGAFPSQRNGSDD